jgi:heme/copper-type cytochrome/quinol oxidase subunit 3
MHVNAAEMEYTPNRFGVAPLKMGVWVFLASEIMFFTGMLGSFAVLKIAQNNAFHHDAGELNWVIGAINMVVLLTSSLTMALAVTAAQKGDQKRAGALIGTTFLLGLCFLILKSIEYAGKFEHGIYPSTSLFFAFYFTLTGCHALHIIGGLVPLVILYLRTRRGTLTGLSGEVMGLYWHFVDVVWIFLFPLLYLL